MKTVGCIIIVLLVIDLILYHISTRIEARKQKLLDEEDPVA